ncbi:MAG TPA: hypothetical protein VGF06_12050 [Terriglobales bacterium]|jgi:hypothetical protein
MYSTLVFAAGLLATLAISAIVMLRLRGPLNRLLTELCGTAVRAEFWVIASSVALAFVPVIFVLVCGPDPSCAPPLVLTLAAQLKWGLIGVVVSVLVLGWMLGRFIPRPTPRPPA